MEAKDLFFRLSYEQYKKGKKEERVHWEEEVISEVLVFLKEERPELSTATIELFLEFLHQVQMNYSNSLEFEQIIIDIVKKEKNEKVAQVIKNCWVACWDYLEKKNACVQTNKFYDGSYLVKITSELTLNLSRMAWFYTTSLLLRDISPYADFNDRISLSNLNKKFAKDLKEDTDEGTEYLLKCTFTNETTKVLQLFVCTFYKAGLVFTIMHEVGHILELDGEICKLYDIVSSKKCMDGPLDKKIRKSEENADYIGCLYSDAYVGVRDFFNVGPLLVMLVLAVNHKNVYEETDHPSIKRRYEKLLYTMLQGKDSQEIHYTKQILNDVCNALQDMGCWSEDEKDWWII